VGRRGGRAGPSLTFMVATPLAAGCTYPSQLTYFSVTTHVLIRHNSHTFPSQLTYLSVTTHVLIRHNSRTFPSQLTYLSITTHVPIRHNSRTFPSQLTYLPIRHTYRIFHVRLEQRNTESPQASASVGSAASCTAVCASSPKHYFCSSKSTN